MTDQNAAVQQATLDFEDEVERAIDAYLNNNGPFLKRLHLERAHTLGYDEVKVARLWSEAFHRKRASFFASAGFQEEVANLKKDERVRFDESDRVRAKEKPPNIKEKQAALNEMADLYKTDPIAYAVKVKDWAKKLYTTQGALHKAVKIVLDERDDDGEQSQATKLVAIGMSKNVVRWHSPSGDGYVTIRNGKPFQNYHRKHIIQALALRPIRTAIHRQGWRCLGSASPRVWRNSGRHCATRWDCQLQRRGVSTGFPRRRNSW